ncbi:MAG: hypothetical protein A2010_03065 [Nitrospirae bacterium GWD2_57_9]|nr:MAG: hypothetical protein A2010_03065 [Nitrospirae bacterium GWD2_57_9]
MKSFAKYLVAAVLVLLVLAGYSLVKNLTPFDAQRPAVGEPAPPISLEDVTGSVVRLSDYRGKVVLLNFWGSWCTACKEEIPGFKKVYLEFRDKGFTVLGVSVNDVPSSIKELALPYPVAIADRQVSKDYGNVVHIPVSYLIDKDGKIIRKVKGFYAESDLRSHLEQAFKGQ